MGANMMGRYQIKSEIGRGGMATVYTAHDPRFDREVALKLLPREVLQDTEARARFEREAKTIAMLEHPAIVPVYDYGEDNGQLYLVMRLMKGGSLTERLKRGALSLAEATRLTERLAGALDAAHAKGIIHRDLKPGNVLFDEYDNPYISDFGIAKWSQASVVLTRSNAVVGTPAYMSPEQIRGESDIDRRSDIYAFGAILFEMLTGRLPYEGDTPYSIMLKHVSEPVPRVLDSNPNLPATCQIVIERAMAKEREARFHTAGEMARVLDSAAAGEAAAPQASPLTRVSTKPKSRIPVGGMVFIGVLVLGIAIAVVALGHGASVSNLPAPSSQGSPSANFAPNQTLIPPTEAAGLTAPTAISPTLNSTAISAGHGDPRISDFAACAAPCLPNGNNAIRTFPEGTTKIYLQWGYANIPRGSHYVRRWTMDGNEWVKYDCAWPGPDAGTDQVTLKEPGGLHAGTWELTIVVNDKVLLHEQVAVEGSSTYWSPAGTFTSCYGK